MNVLDLGAAPGSWCQYAQKKLKNTGKLVAIDLLPMDMIPSVEFILGDINDDIILKQLTDLLNNEKLSLVLSDIAPNITGMKDVDSLKSVGLCELTMDIALTHLTKNGTLVLKIFQGTGFQEFLKLIRINFKKVNIFKPKSSRPDSREVYLIASFPNMLN